MKLYLSFGVSLILAFLTLSPSYAQQSWSTEHVYYGRGGSLTYNPDELGNTIPDFSHVGYRYGDEPIPEIAVKVEVFPVEGDDGSVIQAAIDSVSAMAPDASGFRGAVLLHAGTYQVSGQLLIGSSGVVLRGVGDSDEGTVIVAEGSGRRDLIKADNGAARSVDPSSTVAINESYVPVGRKYVVVADAKGFDAGEEIVLYRPGTANWISDIKMDQITPSEGTVQWNPSSYSFYFERLITKVSGDTLFFRNPVVMAMETPYGGGTVSKFTFDRLEHIGIENLCLKSAYQSETDEEHSWKAISFHSVENSWVRNVTSWYFAYSCVSLERDSRLVSVLNCHCRDPKSLITGGRRYSFNLVGSLHLFKNCTTTEGRHDFVTSARVCGPNVFTHCSASSTHSDAGPHHRWAMGTLFDVIVSDGEINVQDRDDSGTGHGWAGANQVFWNCQGRSSICQSPWTSAKNYNFGFLGKKKEGVMAGRPDGEWVGQNLPGLFPASLYEAQLDQRINQTTLFSAISQLEQIDDSTFRLSFTLPIDPSQIIPENFPIGGSAGLATHPLVLAQYDDYSVDFIFSEIGILPTFSTLLINAEKLSSKEGQVIEGITEAVFMEPDKRPLVSGPSLTVDNEEGYVLVSSSKPGQIYLAKFGSDPGSKSDLDSLVALNLGRMEEAPEANVGVVLPAKGLSGGYYYYFAVDLDQRVSQAGKDLLLVRETGPVVTRQDFLELSPLVAYQRNDLLVVEALPEEFCSLEVYDISGKLVSREDRVRGIHAMDLQGKRGIFVIRSISESKVSTLKIGLF